MDFVAVSKKVISVISISILVGCASSDPVADLRVELEDMKNQEGSAIKPPPEFRIYENFIYSASLLRSPFQPPMKEAILPPEMPEGKQVSPDFTRPPEPLEQFSLDALFMVGTINRPDGQLYALIQDNKSGIHRVQTGSYMGRNHGRILSIDESKIDVLELISDGRSGWVERPRSIVLESE